MKNLYINDIHMNIFKRYKLKKEFEKNRLLKKNVSKNKSMNIPSKNLSIQTKKNIQNLSQNMAEEKSQIAASLKNNIITRQILTPVHKLKHKLLEPNKKDELESTNELFLPIKSKFNLNNLVNSFLYKIYLDNSYKKILMQRIEPFMHKKEKDANIILDLRQTQKKGCFYIPIKKNNNRLKNSRKEIGIQSSLSSNNIYENKFNYLNLSDNKSKEEKKDADIDNSAIKIVNYNYNNNIYNNYKKEVRHYSSKKKPCISPNIKNCKLTFNKYELINKKFAKNIFEYTNNGKNKGCTKIKRIISTERRKMGKILDKLRYEQNNDIAKLKLDLAKLEVFLSRKNKKINSNYNLFL